MWILHPKVGFLSVVEKDWDKPNGTLTIRARVYDDLVRLKAYLPSMSDIISSEDSDYRHRTVADREAVKAAMSMLTKDIDYDNFKNAVGSRQGYERAAVYANVWDVLYRLQSSRFDQQPAPPTMF
jgi:predicted CopG family antitoxin